MFISLVSSYTNLIFLILFEYLFQLLHMLWIEYLEKRVDNKLQFEKNQSVCLLKRTCEDESGQKL